MSRHPHTHDALIAVAALAPIVGVVAVAAVSALTTWWKARLRPPTAGARGAPRPPWVRARQSAKPTG